MPEYEMAQDQSNINVFALQDILLGIVDGLNEAQERLRSLPPYDAYGRPNMQYQLPYLEFNLQVTTEFESSTTGQEKEPRPFLRFKAAPATVTSSNRVEIFSTLSGRFVAVLPNEGLPQMVLSATSIQRITDRRFSSFTFDLEVLVTNAVGEKMVGVTVEFNFNPELSASLSKDAPLAVPVFGFGEVMTGSDGIARNSVSVPKVQYTSNNQFVIALNVGTVSRNISL